MKIKSMGIKKELYTRGLFVLLVVIIITAGHYYWKNFRGIGPAVNPPPADIAELITGENKPGENTTGMPLAVPANFTISIFAKDLPGARVLQALDNGLAVSQTSVGKVVLVRDTDRDGVADKTHVLLEGLNKPHGLVVNTRGDEPLLYVAETHRLVRYIYDAKNYALQPGGGLLWEMPKGGRHFTRTLGFGPDDRLYVSIGSSCDVCVEKDERYAKIFSMNKDGSDVAEYANGLRNAVFFAFHPVTGALWATEMGRDGLGDDLPPDEINIVGKGGNYGWPFCYGNKIHDTAFDKNVYVRSPCADTVPPMIELPAHSAPLGLAFIPEDGWPESLHHDLIVAYHGSWNRSVPTGYALVRIPLDKDGHVEGEIEPFVTGWLTQDNKALGRPVDVLAQPGGIMYISDDKAGVVYQLKLRTGI